LLRVAIPNANLRHFFGCGGLAFLQGFLTKTGVKTWFFCGDFVVECVANVAN
jgi:hypothetical protein